MRFGVFPKRSADDRKNEIKDTPWMSLIFAVLATAGPGLTIYDIEHPFAEGSRLKPLSSFCLVIGVISVLGVFHSLFELAEALTVGPERFIALLIGAALLCSIAPGVV